jgi:predicted dehydrogenase
MVQLSLKGAQREEKVLRPLEVPASYRSGWPEEIEPRNVARLYARMAQDLREGTRTAPSFDDAVAVHRIVAAIERAAENGNRTAPCSGANAIQLTSGGGGTRTQSAELEH